MNILVLGSGGREHVFTSLLAKSDKSKKLYVAPGNAGTESIAENVAIDPLDFEAVADFCVKEEINMVVVGPEAPLVKGIKDYFLKDDRLKDVALIGPDAEGAQLEGSKEFSKRFMQKHHIPTAAYQSFEKGQFEQAKIFLKKQNPPFVLKADGLAAGKGVIIAETYDEAERNLYEMLEEAKFGEASQKVVIEQFLDGIELSVFVLTDGDTYKILPSAKDYKRIGENDMGLNTGGMGAISPVPFAEDKFLQKVEEKIVKPTIEGLKKEHINYDGFIFIGLMKVGDEPYVIEYNVRMGDPETQVVLPRLNSDLLDLLNGVARKDLKSVSFEINPNTMSTVVLVAGGYPESYQKGKEIKGLEDVKNATVYHAGTKRVNDSVVTNGGRVLALSAAGADLETAIEKSYQAAKKLCWEDMYYRKDIGKDLLAFIKK